MPERPPKEGRRVGLERIPNEASNIGTRSLRHCSA